MIPLTGQNLNLFFILTFYYKYLKKKNMKNILNLEIKTVLYLECNGFYGFVEVYNGKAEQPA